jgi:hypothetical protein
MGENNNRAIIDAFLASYVEDTRSANKQKQEIADAMNVTLPDHCACRTCFWSDKFEAYLNEEYGTLIPEEIYPDFHKLEAVRRRDRDAQLSATTASITNALNTLTGTTLNMGAAMAADEAANVDAFSAKVDAFIENMEASDDKSDDEEAN